MFILNISAHDEILGEIIGITIGWDPAPFSANRFLCFTERQGLLNLKKLVLITEKENSMHSFIIKIV